ncbi:MAG: peptide chain release factor 1 [Bacilli bacterium]
MFERLDSIKIRNDFIKVELTKPEVISDIKKTRELSKEQSDLSEIVEVYDEYLKANSDYAEAKELSSDPELGAFAKEELERLDKLKTNLESKLEIILLPKDPNDGKNIIIEIRGAAGGDEANLFAGDLYDMYIRYAESQGYSIEDLDSVPGTSGGFAQVSFLIKGKNVYSKLKYESGAHRVQRVPTTESQGRVHTSTATVVVMPEANDFDIEIKPEDIRVDVYRSSGAGGQGVNTTDSAVRITYLPTGMIVTCQNERSQIKNKEKAMQILKSRVYEENERKKQEAEADERKSKIGTGDRAEKIRTYNYPQNRVTDHRIGFTTKQLDRVMNGKMDEIIDALINEDQRRKIEGK